MIRFRPHQFPNKPVYTRWHADQVHVQPQLRSLNNNVRHFTERAKQRRSHQQSCDATKKFARKATSASSHTVTIHEKRLIPIFTSKINGEGIIGRRSGSINIPLTVTDFHLRHEQLPFAYFFHETLDIEELASSLQRVLAFYPIVGGSIDLSRIEGGEAGVYIRCQANGEQDTIPLSVGKTDVPLSYWLGEATTHRINDDSSSDGNGDIMGHVHNSGAGHPTLLPLFDPLFSPATSGASSDRDSDFHNLITIRITLCSGGGTIIGVNTNHALADAASCVRLVECWGREMRREIHHSIPRGGSNDRSSATCSGMMSQELLNLMGVEREETEISARNQFLIKDLLPDFATNYYYGAVARCDDVILTARSTMLGAMEDAKEKELLKSNETEDNQCPPSMQHEYVHLPFTPATLDAMKAHGMMQSSKKSPTPADTAQNSPGFVSTNDMVTAVGWLIKRQLSGQANWNMSMIVNLRGRCGVDNFADFDSIEHDVINSSSTNDDSSNSEHGMAQQSSPTSRGVFGNGITNVVAILPPSSIGKCPCTSDESRHKNIAEVSSAAMVIRDALTMGFGEIPNRIAHSRIGNVIQPSQLLLEGGTSGLFSTTSWGAFSSLWDIRFSSCANGKLMGFHAHPSHPLPWGKTFSSVVVPTKSGGYVYELLLPSHLAQDAKKLHHDICISFLDWHIQQNA